MKTFLQKLRENTDGSSALEFVITLPMLLLLMVIIIDLSYMFYVQNQLEAASREGARSCSIANNSATAIAQAEGAAPNGADFTIAGACVKTGNVVKVTATVPGSKALLISYLIIGDIITGKTFSSDTSMVTEW